MKKRIVSIMMTGILAAALLAGCGGSKPAEQPAEQPAGETAEQPAETEAVDYGSGEIKIWVAENVVDFTKSQCDAFFAANPDMAGYTVTVEPVGEGDAAGNVITDVEGGVDIYGFAQDQLARLVSAGALTPITGDEQTLVSGWNDEASVNRILREFGLPEDAHIVNGHVPVLQSSGESPVKCGGKVLIIDGGFSRAYQSVTGIAGYTLIYNSYGMQLVAHKPFTSKEDAIVHETDIHSDRIMVMNAPRRMRVADTDDGKVLKERILELRQLLKAYRSGMIGEKS